ncbi:MAG: hypothetical protein GTO71_03505 [Woeseiaceae bacterium]|nr:hypothetical protein [Woeseiaceae bacterium]NIP20176.1 hypothetical protein [Woeseiaceae bacterium]NIS88972.1 hypothetical protein [Woeseiaceae bacterium]
MKTLQAPRTSIGRGAASFPALLMLVALSSSALAATEIQSPCPEAASSSDVLHAFIARDAAESAVVQTVEATETISSPAVAGGRDEQSAAESDDLAAADAELKDAPFRKFTTRLPDVSVNDLPGFRKHMYRTDI